jgi:hypothetical protein
MTDFKVYDKVKWHWPEGKGCPSLEAAKRHINFVMEWLDRNRLLSEDGQDLFAAHNVDDQFALTSEMTTPEGNRVLDVTYREWLKHIEYEGPLNSDLFDEALARIRGSSARTNPSG